MIKKLTRLLGNIVGRIKQYMAVLWLGIASFLFPIGVYAGIEAEDKLSALVLLVMGSIALIMTVYSTYKEERANRQERNQIKVRLEILLANITSELKGLRKYLKNKGLVMAEIIESNPVHCKNCDSTATIKFGVYKVIQRYFCKDCKHKFKADDTTFHMKTDANEVSSALNMYYEGMRVKAIRRHLQQEFNHAPSIATIYEWIMKYTQYATDSIKGYHPEVGNIWIADETVLKVDEQNVWFWDIIDDKTRYLLASRVSRSRTTRDAQMLMDRAIKTAGKSPQTVLTDKLSSYLDVNYGKGTEHIQGAPFNIENNTNLIERFHGTLKARTKVMRGLKI